MSMKKATLASLILLSLTACSSGGSGGGSNNVVAPSTKVQTSQEQKNKEAAEKAAKEKAAKEKAEAERLSAEKAAKEKAEVEDLAAKAVQNEKLDLRANKLKEISDAALRMGYSEAESNEYAQSVVDKVINEDFHYLYHNLSHPFGLAYKFFDDAQKLLQEAGLDMNDEEYSLVQRNLNIIGNENLNQLKEDIAKAVTAKEKRLADEKIAFEKEEAERKAREDKLQDLINKAIQAGLSDEEAQDYANENIDNDEVTSAGNLNIIIIDKAKGIKSADYKQGLNFAVSSQELDTSTICSVTCEARNITTTTHKQLYNQKYSVVTADYTARSGWIGNASNRIDSSYVEVTAKGVKTDLSAIPNEGKATYAGQVFNISQEGSLEYTVDFKERLGSGKISGVYVGDLSLDKGYITGGKISSTATLIKNGSQEGSYSLEFFGPKAEEIGGKLSIDNNLDYGLAGTRGEIQK